MEGSSQLIFLLKHKTNKETKKTALQIFLGGELCCSAWDTTLHSMVICRANENSPAHGNSVCLLLTGMFNQRMSDDYSLIGVSRV